MDTELVYLLLICSLLVVPRALQRFRIPAPLTCFLFGMLLAELMPGKKSGPVHFSAALGISALFLYAGMEVDLKRLLLRWKPLLISICVRLLELGLVVLVAVYSLQMAWQPALLLALAVLTSSSGSIMDTMESFRMEATERFWVTNLAITGELVALALMFVALRSGSAEELAESSVVLLAMVALIPLAYLALARWVLRHAPGSEFSMLVVVGIAAAYTTERLGVEYLLGAFAAGLVARQLQSKLPALASEKNFHALKLFASFFVPFYFLRNGGQVSLDAFGWDAVKTGALLCLLIPVRIGLTIWERRAQGDSAPVARRIALSLSPTLVITLVLAHILHERFALPGALYAGLLIYAGVNTLLPSLLMRGGVDDQGKGIP